MAFYVEVPHQVGQRVAARVADDLQGAVVNVGRLEVGDVPVPLVVVSTRVLICSEVGLAPRRGDSKLEQSTVPNLGGIVRDLVVLLDYRRQLRLSRLELLACEVALHPDVPDHRYGSDHQDDDQNHCP